MKLGYYKTNNRLYGNLNPLTENFIGRTGSSIAAGELIFVYELKQKHVGTIIIYYIHNGNILAAECPSDWISKYLLMPNNKLLNILKLY